MNYLIKTSIVLFTFSLNSCTQSYIDDDKKISSIINDAKKYEFYFERGDSNTVKPVIEIPDSIGYALLTIFLEDKKNTLKILLPVDFIKYVAVSTNKSIHKMNYYYLTISLIQRDMKAHSGGNYCFEIIKNSKNYQVKNIYYTYQYTEYRVNPEYNLGEDPDNHLYLSKDHWVVKLKNTKNVNDIYILPDSLSNENMEEIFITNNFPFYNKNDKE